jgi:hypothetical protein
MLALIRTFDLFLWFFEIWAQHKIPATPPPLPGYSSHPQSPSCCTALSLNIPEAFMCSLSTSLTVAYLYRLFFISHNYLTLQRFLFNIIKNIDGKDMWTLEFKKKRWCEVEIVWQISNIFGLSEGIRVLVKLRDQARLRHPAWQYLVFTSFGGCFLGVKRTGCEADHSPPFGAMIKKEWSYAFSLHVHTWYTA